MKQIVVWSVAVGALCAFGRSKNIEADCQKVSAARSGLKSGLSLPALKSEGELDSASVQRASNAAAEASTRLTGARLEDKTLGAVTFALVSELGSLRRELDAARQTLASDDQAADLKKGYDALLEKSQRAMNDTCEKKERHRKTARKTRLECQVVRTMLEGLSVDILPPEGLQNAAEGLKNLPVSIKPVREAVDKIAEDMLKIRDVRDVRFNLQKKILGHRAKLAKLAAGLGETTAKLEAICKAGK